MYFVEHSIYNLGNKDFYQTANKQGEIERNGQPNNSLFVIIFTFYSIEFYSENFWTFNKVKSEKPDVIDGLVGNSTETE